MLPDLPPELIEHCISYLDLRDSTTLAAVCRTSVFCNRAATPRLYRRLSLRDATPGAKAPSDKLKALCRTLLDKPSLATLPIDSDFELRHEPLSHQTTKLLGRGPLWYTLRERLSADIRTYHRLRAIKLHDVVVEDEPWLLLPFELCRGLRSLNLTGLLGLIQHMPLVLKLHTMRSSIEGMACEYSDLAISGADLVWVFKLPRLRSLRLSSLCRSLQLYELDGPSIGLESLEIGSCNPRMDDLEPFLMRCDDLRSLSFEYTLQQDAHRSYGWPFLGETLRQACPKLRALRLDSSPRWTGTVPLKAPVGVAPDITRCPPMEGLGTLQSLTAMESLTITENALRGVPRKEHSDEREDPWPRISELLPSSLKQLILVCDDEYIQDKASLLQDPFLAQLDECVILNNKKDRRRRRYRSANSDSA